MNAKENEIANELLDTIVQANEKDKAYTIDCYSAFLNAVSLRLSVEAQQIDNEKRRNL